MRGALRTWLAIGGLLIAAAAGAYALWPAPAQPEDLGGAPEEARPVRPARPEVAAALVVPRVGVRGPADRGLVAEPGATPWSAHILHLTRPPGTALTGERLLEAIGERLYVRVREARHLEALRALTFEGVEADTALPLPGAVALLEAAGWRVSVKDPHMMLQPAGAEDAKRLRREPEEPAR